METIEIVVDNSKHAPPEDNAKVSGTDNIIQGNADNSSHINTIEPVQDKFAGKSSDEIKAAYLDLEKQYGQQSNEIGNLRNLRTTYESNMLEQQKHPKPPIQPPAPYVTGDNLTKLMTDNPTGAVQEITRQVEDSVLKSVANQRLVDADSKFNDPALNAQAVTGTPEFQKWVRENIPHGLAAASDEQEASGNPATLNYIVSQYRTSQNQSKEQPNIIPNNNQSDQNKLVAAKNAATISGSGRSVGNNESTNIITHAELDKMSPEEYQRRNNEIVVAFKEGRVR